MKKYISIIVGKCGSNNDYTFNEEGSIKILKFFGLINNMKLIFFVYDAQNLLTIMI